MAALTPYVRAAADAAKEAGALLRRRVGRPRTITTKRNFSDLVTDTDRASEGLIRRRLERAFPTFGFSGEEHGRRREAAPHRWIVDPIDGTTNFVHGIPFFCISIGLQYRTRLLVGVVYDPIRDELFSAAAGQGSWLNGTRLSVSPIRRLSQSLLSTGFSSRFREHPRLYLTWFQAFESRCHAVRRIGSTALCMAYVAAGRFEGFYEQDLWPWDIAAGILLVEEAGGRVTGFTGQPVRLDAGRLVASNRHLHRALLRVLQHPRVSPL